MNTPIPGFWLQGLVKKESIRGKYKSPDAVVGAYARRRKYVLSVRQSA
ncbi:hypothetical protein ARMA_2258 [Ardenticatena maritima]|uniref:Uncharacterized protein n=1 Tax=Ardenticatena maritima TaxID=872965 RepID=A0A0M8K8C2_9CHLR|nr:hypothetical protein ARMA_2258 [Ardenticatena maritima]